MPSTKSSAKLMYDLGQDLLLKGHEVSIITVCEDIDEKIQTSIEDCVNVVRIKSGKIDGANRYIRAFNEIRLSSRIWKNGKDFFHNNTCDLVIWYSPSIFFGSLIKKIKKKNNCFSYLILRDIFPQWALDTGILKKGIIFNFFKKIEIVQYENADIIGVQSPDNLLYFKNNNLYDKYKIEVLYNWTSIVNTENLKTEFRLKLGLENKVVFFYGGNIGQAQDLQNIIRLASRIQNETSAHFLIVGDGTESIKLKKIISKLQLKNISILKSVDQSTYFAMLSEFDVGLISLERNFRTSNFPGKMLGYMQYSKPILASINPGNDLKKILLDNNAGLVSINGDDDLLVTNCLYLIQNPDARNTIGKNGYNLLKNIFSVNKASSQILGHFKHTNYLCLE
jgi:glycosyltransferase involved in cell wall biosynthesis